MYEDHTEGIENKIVCHYCDETFETKDDVMKHRKKTKKWGHRRFWGAHFWRHRNLRGQNGGTPPKKFQNFWLEIFLRSI